MIDALVLVRGIHFAASLLAAGTACFLVLVVPAAGTALRRPLSWLTWAALAFAVLSGAVWLVLLASDIQGASVAEVSLLGGAWSVLGETRFGQVWSARLALALLLALLLPWPGTRWLQLAAAAGFVALPAWVGHAGAAPELAGTIHLTSDVVHLLAAGAWLGGLPALAILLAQARRQQDWAAFAARATARFSRLGVVSVGALLASGVVNSWNLLGGPRDLLATDYGRLLLLKIGLFLAMIAIAAVNRLYLTPRLAAPTAMRLLRRNSLAETTLGLGVLLVVGALGAMEPTAHRHTAPADIPRDAAFVHIHSTEAMADVTIDPGRVGRTRAIIRLSREDFSEFSAQSVRLALDPPARSSTAVVRHAVRMTDGTWQTDALNLGVPGIWTVRVVVMPAEAGSPIVLDAPVLIER